MSIKEHLSAVGLVLSQGEIDCSQGSENHGVVRVTLTGRNLLEAINRGRVAHLDGTVTSPGRKTELGQGVMVCPTFGGHFHDERPSGENIRTWVAHAILTGETGIKHGA